MVVDVSIHNGAINWQKAKEAGVKGALIRCGYGRDFTKYDDANYSANMEGALAVGIKVGVYLYSYAKDITGAISEAEHALRLLAPYKGKLSLPVFYDVEEEDRAEGVVARVKVFCQMLRNAGYKVGVYANLHWWTTYLSSLDTTGLYVWLAKWGGDLPSFRAPIDIWQYDAYGRVPGIGSGVDMDKVYGELADIVNGVTPTPTPTPTPGGYIMVKTTLIKKGDKGDNVFSVQAILKAKGYKGKNGKVLALDSSFGGNSEYATMSFQKENGLKVDGIVGAETWDKLING